MPLANVLARRRARAFEIAQGRLGPGRVHHCMRLIGLAELALELAIQRGTSRTAFGKPLVNLGGNRERIADARIAIDQARLLVLNAAWKLDVGGPLDALSEVSQIKVAVPNMAQQVIDMAIQLHGGGGLTDDFPLAAAWTSAPAPCGSPTGPTRCTAAWSPASSSGKHRMSGPASPAAASRGSRRRRLGDAASARARGDEVLAATDVLGARRSSRATGAARPGQRRPRRRRSDDDWAAALAWVEQHWGGLDVLVNNAGVAGGGRIDVATLDEWQWITEINLFGVVRGTRTFVPMFKQQRSGHIVNIASLAGLVHPAGHGLLQRGQGRGRGVQRDRRATSSRRTASGAAWSARRTSAPT